MKSLIPPHPSSWHLRLNKRGEVYLFMQQEYQGQKRPLTEDERFKNGICSQSRTRDQ